MAQVRTCQPRIDGLRAHLLAAIRGRITNYPGMLTGRLELVASEAGFYSSQMPIFGRNRRFSGRIAFDSSSKKVSI